MSVLYGSLTGQAKTTVTRRGSKKSGIACHVRGWDLGVRVSGRIDDNGVPVFDVYRTSGSNGGNSDIKVTEVR